METRISIPCTLGASIFLFPVILPMHISKLKSLLATQIGTKERDFGPTTGSEHLVVIIAAVVIGIVKPQLPALLGCL